MTDINRAFDIENGITIEGGSFITSGPNSPVGLDLPEGTFYIQSTSNGHIVWNKFGATTSNWRKLSGQDVPSKYVLDDNLTIGQNNSLMFADTLDGVDFNITLEQDAILEIS